MKKSIFDKYISLVQKCIYFLISLLVHYKVSKVLFSIQTAAFLKYKMSDTGNVTCKLALLSRDQYYGAESSCWPPFLYTL